MAVYDIVHRVTLATCSISTEPTRIIGSQQNSLNTSTLLLPNTCDSLPVYLHPFHPLIRRPGTPSSSPTITYNHVLPPSQRRILLWSVYSFTVLFTALTPATIGKLQGKHLNTQSELVVLTATAHIQVLRLRSSLNQPSSSLLPCTEPLTAHANPCVLLTDSNSSLEINTDVRGD